MDRMEDSGSSDLGSNPGGVTFTKRNEHIYSLLRFLFVVVSSLYSHKFITAEFGFKLEYL